MRTRWYELNSWQVPLTLSLCDKQVLVHSSFYHCHIKQLLHCYSSDSDFNLEFINSVYLHICVLGKPRAIVFIFSTSVVESTTPLCPSIFHLIRNEKLHFSVLFPLYQTNCINFSYCVLPCGPPKEEVLSLNKTSGYFCFAFLLMFQISPYSLSLNFSPALCLYLTFFKSISCHFDINLLCYI